MGGNFATLAAKFESLQKDFEQTNDPALRRALLIEIRTKLESIQEIATSKPNALANSDE